MNELHKAEKIIERLCQCGYEAYICGGPVRDMFLGAIPLDIDIVTQAEPEELEKIFPDKKVKTFGISFLVTSVDGIDVATYRSDKNSGPGRFNCVAEACETLEQDLARRDFTFNALAVCSYTGEIIDPFNGRSDLERKIVRFVGDAEQRIFEDPLRMIRAARFAALIDGHLHDNTFRAIRRNKFMVNDISPERIRIELLKVMKYKTPSVFFDILHSTGIMELLFPEFQVMYNHTGGKYHTEPLHVHAYITGDSLSNKDPILRLVGYFHDIGKPPTYDGTNFIDHEKIGSDMIRRLFKKYRFTIKETSRAKKLVRYHMRSIDSVKTPKSARRLLKVFSDNNVSFKDWIKLKIADKKGNLTSDDYTREEIKSFCLIVHNSTRESKNKTGFDVKDLKVNGNDVMELLNIKPGKQIGDILKKLLEIVVDDPESNKRETLLSLVLQMK
ncbi:MAG: CCA tRNA nucleotidyltransferase [Vallitaleaceae bacterium]|nr:CCA tRNA nucleotidyltransferase [Vallitaleaceae bacterium]